MDAELGKNSGLGRQRLALNPVRRDRVTDETARLDPLVVHRDVVPECRELARARKPRGACADHGDPQPVVRRAPPERGAG